METPIQGKPANILLVEDNEGDALLTRKAFERSKLENTLTVATDGEMALNILRQAPPGIVFLDINLPKMNGRQVLIEMKKNPALKSIPVLALTGSEAEKDVLKNEKIPVDGYIIKPVTLEKIGEAVKTINGFWFGIVAMPIANSSASQKKLKESA